MTLITHCEACGRGVTGAFSKLTKVQGRYVCAACKTNPTGHPRYYCTNCYSQTAYAAPRGSGWIELVLYLCYIIPGVVYSIWRRTGAKACPVCKHDNLVPIADRKFGA